MYWNCMWNPLKEKHGRACQSALGRLLWESCRPEAPCLCYQLSSIYDVNFLKVSLRLLSIIKVCSYIIKAKYFAHVETRASLDILVKNSYSKDAIFRSDQNENFQGSNSDRNIIDSTVHEYAYEETAGNSFNDLSLPGKYFLLYSFKQN